MSQQSRISAVIQRIANEFKAVKSDMGGIKHVKITRAEFEALPAVAPDTVYYFTDWT